MKCCISELFDKQIINLRDGACLGTPSDFEFDMTSGKLEAITVCIKPKGFPFSQRAEKITICFDRIQVIGDDTILVDTELPSRIIPGRKSNLLSSVFRDG